MSPPDLFGVLTRVLGLWLVFLGIRSSCSGAYYVFQVGFSGDIVGQFLATAVPEILVGLYLLTGARALARRCFVATPASVRGP